MTKEEILNKWKEKCKDGVSVNQIELYNDLLLYAIENSEEFEFVDIKQLNKEKEGDSNV